MLILRKIIEKSLLFRKSGSSTPPSYSNAYSKISFLANLLSKATKRCNEANLGYFDSYLNKAYSKGEMILVGKDMYYQNMMLFVQHFRSFVTFKEAVLIKANVTISL